MVTPQRKQLDYLMRARRSAALKDYQRVRQWIKKAEECRAISEMQWYRIKLRTSEEFVGQLKREMELNKD